MTVDDDSRSECELVRDGAVRYDGDDDDLVSVTSWLASDSIQTACLRSGVGCRCRTTDGTTVQMMVGVWFTTSGCQSTTVFSCLVDSQTDVRFVRSDSSVDDGR